MAETNPTARLQIIRPRDQHPHQRLLITLPRVIQMHHLQLQICLGQLLQMMNFWAQTIFCTRRQQQMHTPVDNNIFHAGYLENGNNAYLLELPALEKMLNTQKFLMDEMSGQFYTVYGNSYQQMSMKPMLKQAWATRELINQLTTMRQAFGYTGLVRSTPPLAKGVQPTASTSHQPDDLLPRQPAPNTVQYQPPSFKLTRPMVRLMKNERIQVHHNYISAVSSLEHKRDLINRLK